MKFTEHELKALETHPDALRAAADYNDNQESEADAAGFNSFAEHHRARRLELAAEANRIERLLDAGLPVETACEGKT